MLSPISAVKSAEKVVLPKTEVSRSVDKLRFWVATETSKPLRPLTGFVIAHSKPTVPPLPITALASASKSRIVPQKRPDASTRFTRLIYCCAPSPIERFAILPTRLANSTVVARTLFTFISNFVRSTSIKPLIRPEPFSVPPSASVTFSTSPTKSATVPFIEAVALRITVLQRHIAGAK